MLVVFFDVLSVANEAKCTYHLFLPKARAPYENKKLFLVRVVLGEEPAHGLFASKILR